MMNPLLGLKLALQDIRKLRIILYVLTGEYPLKGTAIEIAIKIVTELMKDPTDNNLMSNLSTAPVVTLNIYTERLGGTKPKGSALRNAHSVYEQALVRAFRSFLAEL